MGNQGKLSPGDPKKGPQYIFDIILMAVQSYAYGSLFTPLYPDYMTEGGEGRVDHERLQTRRYTHLSADCSPHTRRLAGGGADSRMPELSAFRRPVGIRLR
jgi:hypothetical protein